MRRILTNCARRHFPSKAAADRVIPWIQLLGLIVGGLFALYQFASSVHDRRATDTVKLLDRYFERNEKFPSLKDDYEQLFEDARRFIFEHPTMTQLPDGATEAEKQRMRQLLLEREITFVNKPDNEQRYRRLLVYFELIGSCAAQRRCDASIVNGTIGGDLFGFVNNACGYFELIDRRWSTTRTGATVFDYVLEQRLYLPVSRANPFRCEKFRSYYAHCSKVSILVRDLLIFCN